MMLDELQKAIDKFPPGATIELIVGLPREIDFSEFKTIEDKLRQNIDLIEFEYGSTPEWDNALRIVFGKSFEHNPIAIPFAAALILALGAVGIAGILGWRVGEVISEIGKHILPLSLIFVGAYVVTEAVKIGRTK